MKKGTDTKQIYEAIFDVVRCIPEGRVTSYGAVAKSIGLKSGARMVGRAMGHAGDLSPKVPFHRVVNSTGVLSGGHDRRQKLLEEEGLQVKNSKVQNFKELFWDPLKEITI